MSCGTKAPGTTIALLVLRQTGIRLCAIIALISSLAVTAAVRSTPAKQESHNKARSELIQPGVGVGPLKLGDARATVFTMFPKRGGDQEFPTSCGGDEYNWLDNYGGPGHVFIRFKNGVVSQIDSATRRFRTADGISLDSTPAKIKQRYPTLRAFILERGSDVALGNLPLIYWIDQKRGIAFAFAYYPEKHQRYLYEIIVFEPGSEVCPFDGTNGSPHELPPFSLRAPNH